MFFLTLFVPTLWLTTIPIIPIIPIIISVTSIIISFIVLTIILFFDRLFPYIFNNIHFFIFISSLFPCIWVLLIHCIFIVFLGFMHESEDFFILLASFSHFYIFYQLSIDFPWNLFTQIIISNLEYLQYIWDWEIFIQDAQEFFITAQHCIHSQMN